MANWPGGTNFPGGTVNWPSSTVNVPGATGRNWPVGVLTPKFNVLMKKMTGSFNVEVTGQVAIELDVTASAMTSSFSVDVDSTAPFTPASVSGLQLWLDAQFTSDVTVNTTPNPDQVSAWLDHHTTANDLAQATSGNQPEWETAGWNATHPTVNCRAASSNYLHRNSGIAALINGDDVAWTAFLAVELNSIVAERYLLSWGSSTSGAPITAIRHSAAGVLGLFVRDDANVTTSVSSSQTLVTGTRYIISAVRPASGTVILRVNSADVTPAPPASTLQAHGVATHDRFALAALLRASASNFADARYGAALVYSGALGGTDVADIETYLTARWPV